MPRTDNEMKCCYFQHLHPMGDKVFDGAELEQWRKEFAEIPADETCTDCPLK